MSTCRPPDEYVKIGATMQARTHRASPVRIISTPMRVCCRVGDRGARVHAVVLNCLHCTTPHRADLQFLCRWGRSRTTFLNGKLQPSLIAWCLGTIHTSELIQIQPFDLDSCARIPLIVCYGWIVNQNVISTARHGSIVNTTWTRRYCTIRRYASQFTNTGHMMVHMIIVI